MSDKGEKGASDPFEMMRSLWAPLGVPGPGMVFPTLDPAEVDKRIADLRSVENWLTVNLNVLRMTIQGLEMQKATLATLAAMQPAKPGETASRPAAGGAQNPAEAWWAMLQQAGTPAAKPEKKGK